MFAAAYFNIITELAKSLRHPTWIMSILMGTHFSYLNFASGRQGSSLYVP